jgi:hypothetical protein
MSPDAQPRRRRRRDGVETASSITDCRRLFETWRHPVITHRVSGIDAGIDGG